MSEELKLFYQNESSFNKDSSTDELIKDVFVKAFKIGREIGYNVGYNSGLSIRESFDDCDEDNLNEDDLNLMEYGSDEWNVYDELLGS